MEDNINIYKFRKMDINALSSLSSNKIWFSSKKDLNDPFEGYVKIESPNTKDEKIIKYLDFGKRTLSIQTDLTASEIERMIMQKYLSDPEGFIRDIDQEFMSYEQNVLLFQEKLGIFSTSSDAPGTNRPQTSNMLMWSHYSNEFKGFCIKYDLKSLYESLQSLNPDTTFSWGNISYVDKPKNIDYIGDLEIGTQNFLESIRYKHEQWSYECELRLLASERGLYSHSPCSVKEIYISERMPEEERGLLISVITNTLPKCKLFEVFIVQNSSRFEILTKEIRS